MTNRKFLSLILSIPAVTVVLLAIDLHSAHAAVYEETNRRVVNGVEMYDLVRVPSQIVPAITVHGYRRSGRTTVVHLGNRHHNRIASR